MRDEKSFSGRFCGCIINSSESGRMDMKYRVHRLEVNSGDMQEKLQSFLNNLDGEVISIFPNVKPTFQLMGATAKVNFLLIVEKTGLKENLV
jgi:hypothetical protein